MTLLKTFQDNQAALKRFISRYLHNIHDVEEVAQETFLRAFSAEKNEEIHKPKSFLFRIAKNIAISELRRKTRQITDYIEDRDLPDVLISETLENEAIARQKLGIHCEAVAILPPQCRRVYLMRKVYGMPHKEIAERLDIAVSTVEKHLMQGVERCDRYVRAQMDDHTAHQEPQAKPSKHSTTGLK